MERTLLTAIAIAVAACNPGPDGTYPFDAGHTSPDSFMQPPGCMPPTPLCGTTCGNSQLDHCYVPTMPGHCSFFLVPEPCDGTLGVPSCDTQGFYGGTTACAGCSSISWSGCDACGSSTACGTYAPLAVATSFTLAVSGSRVALGGYYDVGIFEGLTEIARPPLPYVSSVVGVPNGWLVLSSDPGAVTPVALDATAGTSIDFPYNGGHAKLTAGPPGRILALWEESVGEPPNPAWHLFYALLDDSGTVVVGAQDLMTVDGGSGADATSDGTSFFVGSKGSLARIAVDGTASIVSGFPQQPTTTDDKVALTFAGTTGWYISGPGLVLRRFDSTGAAVGSALPMTLGSRALDFAADGSDLLVLRAGTKLDVLRMNSSGVFVSTTEVGGGSAYDGHLARVGTSVFTAWLREGHLQIALASP
jgi:hypothetical protein